MPRVSQRLKCSRHDVYLILRFMPVMKPAGCVVIEYFQCPIPECGYVRANKWERKPVARRVSRERSKPAKIAAKREIQRTLFDL